MQEKRLKTQPVVSAAVLGIAVNVAASTEAILADAANVCIRSFRMINLLRSRCFNFKE
jgi:hypothetical protein